MASSDRVMDAARSQREQKHQEPDSQWPWQDPRVTALGAVLDVSRQILLQS